MKSNQVKSGKSLPTRVGALFVLAILVAGTASLSNEITAPPDLQGQEITLDEAIKLARNYHPKILSLADARLQIQAQGEQAGRGLNPELGFDVESFAGSGDYQGFSSAEYTLALSQTFEMGGKRDRRVDLIGWELKEVELATDLVSRTIEAQVTQAFIETLRAQKEVNLAEDLLRLAEKDLEVVRRKIATGAISRVEETRAQVEVQVAKLAVAKAGQSQTSARLKLTGFWNETIVTFGAVIGNLEAISPLPEWAELVAELDHSPALEQWNLEKGKGRALLNLAKSQGALDLTASAGLRHFSDSGDFAAVAAVSMPLPTRDKNQDAQRAVQYGLDRLDNQRQGQVLELLAELLEHHRIMSTSYLQIITIRDEILPSTEQGLQQAEDAYRKGLFNMTDVLEVRRTWFDWNLEYVAALAEYQSAWAEIQRILGSESRVITNPLEADGNE